MKQNKINRPVLPFLMILALSLGYCGIRGEVTPDLESKNFYEYSRLIMSKQEKDIFLLLPDKESRKEFIQDFRGQEKPAPLYKQPECKGPDMVGLLPVLHNFFRIKGWKR